jgi:MFS superfamily sulfate permease-like transporter
VGDLPSFVIGVVVGIALAAVAVVVRRRSVSDLSGPAVRVSAPEGDGDLQLDAPATIDSRGMHLTQTKVVRRVGARLEPGGRLTVTVDEKEYHRLEDVPDEATREQVRTILSTLPSQTTDPAMRAKIETELHDAGIEPPASAPEG